MTTKTAKRKAPKKRAALGVPPTVRRVAADRDAYVDTNALRRLISRGAPRYWTFHGMPTTVELEGQRYAKSILNFPDHNDDEGRFLELLREYASLGVPRPAGYADAFHAAFKSPRLPYSINVGLNTGTLGGWQEALAVGVHPGVHYKYDLRSAYLWAGSLGMPDVRTYRRVWSIAKEPGVYRVELEATVPNAPYPFNRYRDVLATSDEIELYSLPVRRIVKGITWTKLVDPTAMLDAVCRVSTWKQAGRAYWGRWGQSARVECHTAGGRSWSLPSFAANVPYAALIVSRVKARVWTDAARAVHVFVDSIITPDVLKTSDAIGGWKLEKTYTAGVQVRGAGWYGEPGRRLDRAAGVPASSPLRDRWAEHDPDLLAG
jgi:hypothetical protein